jgi:hypothetical protein
MNLSSPAKSAMIALEQRKSNDRRLMCTGM